MFMARYSAIAAVIQHAPRWVARLNVEGAHAQVALRLQGTRAQRLSQGEGLAVMDFGVPGIRGSRYTRLMVRRRVPPLGDVSLA